MQELKTNKTATAKLNRAPRSIDTAVIDLLDILNDGFDGREDVDSLHASTKASTKHDQRDMYRMGKTQELKRNYRPLSALSFAVVLTATWEYLMIACTQGLVHGGAAGLFWSYIWTFVGFTFVEMSLAEMASMAPSSGGQYHWVSEFAPPQYQQFLSYVVGWMSTLSWQAGNAAGCFLTGTISQALIVVNNPEYEPERWQGTLFVLAMVFLVYFFNICGHNLWPRVQNPLMILHVLAFLAVVTTLWCLAPHRSAKAVFTEFSNASDWNNMGLSLMIGQISAVYSILGADATAHMAEEVRDASRYVPISLFWSYFGNGLMGIIFLIAFLFAMDDVTAALNHPSGYPFLHVFQNTMPLSGVNALTIIVLLLVSAANINFCASTARQTFSFARDRGLPFSTWICQIDSVKQIPSRAIFLSSLIAALFALVNFASPPATAFTAIVSLQVVSLMFTYACSLSCVLYRRITHPELLPPSRWNLGRWGIPINILALAYVSFVLFWSFWVNYTPSSAEEFNWGVVVFVAVFGVCLVVYCVQGRKVYKGPVEEVRVGSLAEMVE